MPLGILFWVLMVIAAVFHVWGYRAPDQVWVRGSGNLLLFLLLAILGWKVFGPVVQ